MEILGERLKRLRENRKLLQKEIAIEIERSEQTYSRYESNLRNPDIFTLQKLALYFNVSTDYLLGLDKTHIDKSETLSHINELEKQIVTLKQYINSCK